MRDSFDYGTYWSLLDRLRESHRIVRFADVSGGEPEEAFCILRHDVDYSPAAALRLAEQEAQRGVAATYFLLAGGDYYNLLAPRHAGCARRLAELGHEIGLHYDVRSFLSFPREQWETLLRAQAALLEALAGQRVTSIAMHQPALHGEDPFRGGGAFLNAYDDRFTREMTYVSDSCRAWRNVGWEMFERGAFPRRLHLCLHPINWGERDRERVAIFRGVHEELIATVAAARDELLGQIACHSGVREHEARAGSRG